MKKNVFMLAVLFSIALTSQAKIWRVNNVSALNADFTSLSTAIASSSVQNGDSIYVEPSASDYGTITLTKQLVLIGSGYFLSGTNGNIGLQENTSSSTIEFITLNSGSEGSIFLGLNLRRLIFGSIGSNGSVSTNVLVEKCRIYDFTPIDENSNNTYSNISIRKCFFATTSDAEIFENSTVIVNNLTVENCIFAGRPVIVPSTSSTNITFRNNTANNIGAVGVYVANNIFLSSATSVLTSCVVRNNLFVANQTSNAPLTGDNGLVFPDNGANLINQTASNIIISSGSTDGQYQLASGSPAIGGGVEINSYKPDCGAYGGPDPYVLSGIPDIPTIYSLSFPNGNTVPSGATSIEIDFSTKNNN